MKFNNDKIDRIKNLRNEINDISGLVGNPSYPTDENRCIFFFTEIDTLMTILNFNEQRAYKILLRTVLEKFLFFWLMFEGKKYRWIAEYRIHQVISKNSKEARDETLKKWNKLK